MPTAICVDSEMRTCDCNTAAEMAVFNVDIPCWMRWLTPPPASTPSWIADRHVNAQSARPDRRLSRCEAATAATSSSAPSTTTGGGSGSSTNIEAMSGMPTPSMLKRIPAESRSTTVVRIAW